MTHTEQEPKGSWNQRDKGPTKNYQKKAAGQRTERQYKGEHARWQTLMDFEQKA